MVLNFGAFFAHQPKMSVVSRMLGRGGILSGDGVYTIRYRAHIADPEVHR